VKDGFYLYVLRSKIKGNEQPDPPRETSGRDTPKSPEIRVDFRLELVQILEVKGPKSLV
jgi:hypothetical protein